MSYFNETQFPFTNVHTPLNRTYQFLDDGSSPYMVHHFNTPINPQVAPLPPSPEPIFSSPTSTFTLPPSSLPHSPLVSHSSLPTCLVTRSQHGIYKPKKSFNLFTSVSKSPLPRNLVFALRDPNWKMAMDDEYNALTENKTWELVPHPPNVNVDFCS